MDPWGESFLELGRGAFLEHLSAHAASGLQGCRLKFEDGFSVGKSVVAGDVNRCDDFVVAVSNWCCEADGALATLGRTYEYAGLQNLLDIST